MDRAEIIKYKDYLLNNLRLSGEYDAALGLKKNVLMVEGKTDEAFVKRIVCPDTRCLPVVELLKARNAFSTSPPAKVNHKEIITTILQRISMFPEAFDFPKGAEKWPLYDLVDNDFGTEASFSRVSKLFFTDTHDIETMMLSTDPELLTRLRGCSISLEETNRALYLAMQLSAFRQAIADNGTLSQSAISNSDGTIDFSKFSEEDRISLPKLIDHLNSQTDSPLSREKLKRTREKIAASMKKLLDKDGLWKKPFSSYTVEQDDPVWMEINGHDVLSAITYVNETAKEVFSNAAGYAKNRDFEFALSESYDYNQLKKTKLHKKLSDNGLIVGLG